MENAMSKKTDKDSAPKLVLPPTKPRNVVVKNALLKTSGAGSHRKSAGAIRKAAEQNVRKNLSEV
jgi:hypothetical protein